jgi:alpha-mannosidase
MLPDNPFLQLALPRATRALARLQSAIWSQVMEVPCTFAGARAEPVTFEAALKLHFKPIRLPHHWGKPFDQGWFRIEIPKIAAKSPLYLHWQDQGEGTAYLDAMPFYGFDVAHRYCALPESASDIYIESICLQSAI